MVSKLPTLKLIVSFDELPAEATKAFKEWAQSQGLEFQTLSECELSRPYCVAAT